MTPRRVLLLGLAFALGLAGLFTLEPLSLRNGFAVILYLASFCAYMADPKGPCE